MITTNLRDLQLENHLYHATPYWNAESVLTRGLKLEFGRNNKQWKKYQCLSESPRIASEMVYVSQKDRMKLKGRFDIVIFGFNLALLELSLIDFLDEDPYLRNGIVTYKDFSPRGIDQIILYKMSDQEDYTDFFQRSQRRNLNVILAS